MTTLRFKRFTRPQVLRSVGRRLLGEFFSRFTNEFQALGLALPAPDSPDDLYFRSVARLLAGPEALPVELNEALFAIDELATAEGQERLEAAVSQARLPLDFPQDLTRAEMAMQVWLASPALLARTHNQQRFHRLSAFECFGAQPAHGPRPPACAAADATLERLRAELDPWFARHQRGSNTTRLELYPIADEFWFLVRHGDTFTRSASVDAQRTEILHFRPERDDVIVYSPEHDEIRINTRTKGERDLYVRKFGLCLRGSEDYFSDPRTYTLEPLRTDGPQVLDTAGIEGIRKIVLREIEVAWLDGRREVVTRESEDLFKTGGADVIPAGWRLLRAGFDVEFCDRPKPGPLQIRPPNLIRIGRHCDLRLLNPWMRRSGLRVRKGGV
jgi:hypothetical protein